MKQILIALPINEKQKTRLAEAANNCNVIFTTIKEATPEQVSNADIIVGNVPSSFIQQSSKLKLLQLNSAGTEAYIKPGVLASETILTNATGAYGQAVAEHMLAMLMSLLKKLHLYRDGRINRDWHSLGTVTTIVGSTVAVIGLGDIGTYFARLINALGGYVIGVKRRPSDCPPEVDELFLMEDLKKVLPRADVVLSILPNTPQTQKIYDDEFFLLMKNSGIFMNAGRGNAVNQMALLKAIQTGEIAAAGLDVTDPEPLPASDPLWNEPNVFITPHVSGHYHLPETLDRIVDIAASNIKAFLEETPLRNEVDFSTGYCK